MKKTRWVPLAMAAAVVTAWVAPLAGASAAGASVAPKPGKVWAWGYNDVGQLGDGSVAQSAAPVEVHGLANVIAVAGNGDDGYALRADGTVWDWGLGTHGELGNGSFVPYHDVPVQVSRLTGVVAIAAGTGGSAGTGYALLSNGTVWAWGYGGGGALGNGTRASSAVPVQVENLSGIKAIAAGDSIGGTGYAVGSNGSVWAWGQGRLGQLGDGSTTSSDVPVLVHGISTAVAVAAGEGDGYALLASGIVLAWGDTQIFAGAGGSALGNGSQTPSSVPVKVEGLSHITSIAAGDYRGYAIGPGGIVWAWGGNDIGNGSRSQESLVPVRVSGLTGVTAVGTDQSAAFALRSNGTVWIWGNTNDTDELGVAGAPFMVNTPIQLRGLADVVGLAPNAAYVITP